MPETANTPFVKARQLFGPAIGASQAGSNHVGTGESNYNRSDNPAKGQIAQDLGFRARCIKKIIVKPYAGKPHVRFERGLMETGRR
jgi:hypothetical protein